MLLLAPLLLQAAHAQTPIQCCRTASVQRAVQQVVRFTEVLVTQPERAHAKLVAVERSVRDDPSLPRTDRDALEAIRRAASEHKRGGDLHAALEELTRQALYLALRHEGGEMVIAEAICTQGEVTTSWLQRDLEVLASPRGDCGGWR